MIPTVKDSIKGKRPREPL